MYLGSTRPRRTNIGHILTFDRAFDQVAGLERVQS